MTDPRRPRPRLRVIVDNDFSGDPDDLFQLVHHVLSPSVQIPLVIASHLSPGDPMDPGDRQAQNAASIARDLLGRMSAGIPVVAGSDAALDAPGSDSTAAVDAIVREALRDDTDLPLYYAAGGGLTDVAAALRAAPHIADRLTLVWIGGHAYDDPAALTLPVEYNLAIDPVAAREVFASRIPFWQVPRDAYRQCLVSTAELDARVRDGGELGRHLSDAIDRVRDFHGHGSLDGETYCLGDNPLVLVTALQSFYGPDASSSGWQWRPAPAIDARGHYAGTCSDARRIRVMTRVDTRLMFEDFFHKLDVFTR
ncbi:nucleoside hydrolase [Microbacterium sp. NPDC056569]|uniref:nucleoside hydrolase n=1 Tax=Microbacterium sp. NPDC056569 TaxID=3345867 RepID=UPI003670C447